MSGITGIYAFNQIGGFYMINLAKAIDKLSPRGPEFRGSFVGRELVAIGHRGTAGSGRQPFTEQTERYTIVMDGEIYNTGMLRKNTDSGGIVFDSATDAELVLRRYMELGWQCLQEFKGCFAFAIYDKEENTLFLARDSMGEKPLLYYLDEDKFAFASEMKSLLAYNIPKKIDQVSLCQYFQWSYVPEPQTIFENVWKLEPGHFIMVKDKTVETKKYHREGTQRHQELSYLQCKEKLRNLLEAAVRERLEKNSGTSVLLENGPASAPTAAIAASLVPELQTFSLDDTSTVRGKKDKAAKATLAATLKTEHTSLRFVLEDATDEISGMLDSLDEPFADISALSLFVISKKVSVRTSAMLSTAGADAIAGAGSKYRIDHLLQQDSLKINFVKKFGSLLQPFSGKGENSWHQLYLQSRLSVSERYWQRNTTVEMTSPASLLLAPAGEVLEMLEKRNSNMLSRLIGKHSISEILMTEKHIVLPGNMLFKTDRMFMSHGLQARLPFMDQEVADFLFSLPEDVKTSTNAEARILKDLFDDIFPGIGLLPYSGNNTIAPLPLLRQELKTLADELMGNDFIAQQGIFKYEAIDSLMKKSMASNEGTALWNLFAFQYWWKRYVQD